MIVPPTEKNWRKGTTRTAVQWTGPSGGIAGVLCPVAGLGDKMLRRLDVAPPLSPTFLADTRGRECDHTE